MAEQSHFKASSVTSLRTGLLPSPFTHGDEAVSMLSSSQPQQDAVTASIYPPEAPIDSPRLQVEEYIEPEDGSLLPPLSFVPFFTMIEDAETGQTYHPSTHYVFEDDDPDVLSSAALYALDAYSEAARQEDEDRAGQGLPRDEERYVVLTLDEQGTIVKSAKSLAPDWAVSNIQVRPAPTFDGDGGQNGEGLMLMVQGISIGNNPLDLDVRGTDTKNKKEKDVQAKQTFEEARKKGGGVVAVMEELAQSMAGGLSTLEKVLSYD